MPRYFDNLTLSQIAHLVKQLMAVRSPVQATIVIYPLTGGGTTQRQPNPLLGRASRSVNPSEGVDCIGSCSMCPVRKVVGQVAHFNLTPEAFLCRGFNFLPFVLSGSTEEPDLHTNLEPASERTGVC